jgi:hypothetical protein
MTCRVKKSTITSIPRYHKSTIAPLSRAPPWKMTQDVLSFRASLEPHIAMVHEGIRKKCPVCNKVNILIIIPYVTYELRNL